MEIYKLSDNVPNEHSLTKHKKYDKMSKVASKDVGVLDGGVLKITDIKQGVKNPNRVNVFINGKYSFSLDVSQVADLKLKVGLEISEEELAEYKKDSEFGKLYQRTLEWVLIRPRSEKETRDYLYKKLRNILRGPSATNEERGSEASPITMGRSERVREDYFEFFDNIIDRLLEKGYVDDAKFARYYVENRFVKKGISRKRLKMELIKKGISKEIIDEVLDVRNDEEEILKIIAKKRAKYDDEKLIAYLCRQGFPYQLAQSLVRGKD